MDINTHSTLKTSLAAYWTLDTNFNDSHSGAHHGTFYNTPTFPVAKLRTGAKFVAASSQYGKVTNHADFQGATMTFAFWFKVDSIPASNQYLLAHHGGGTLNRNVMLGSDGKIYVLFPDNVLPSQIASLSTITPGLWYHVLAFQGGGAVSFYLNNVDQGTLPAFGAAGVSADIYLGSLPTPAQYFNGIIDDFGWWNKVLSSDERNDLYQSGIGITWDGTFTSIKTHPTLRSGMLCHYKFDGNLNDSLGNFNGTAYGSVSYDTGKTGQAATVWTPTYVDLGSQGAWNTSYLSVAFWTYCYIVQNKYPIGRQIGATSCWRMPGYFNWQRFFLTRSGSLDEAQVMLDNLDNSAWNFVAATYDGTDMKISKNAGTPNVTNFPGTIRSASVNTWIGHEYDANSTLDGLSVWDRPLAQSEIVALYNSGNGLTYSIPSAASGVFTSAQSGPWSDPATWGTEDTYPGDGSTVTISAGHTVTIDGSHTVGTAPTNDTTMVLTINDTGWLKWTDNPSSSWTFTIKGNVNIVKGGKFSVGTASVPIPAAQTATVYFPSVNTTGWKIQNLGTLEAYGAEGYHMADATKQRSLLAWNLMSGTGTTLKLADAVDWQAGDTVSICNREAAASFENLVIQSKIDAYTYTVNPTYCHLVDDFVTLVNRNVKFLGYDNAGRGVSIVSTPSAAADIASVVINLSWCSFKYFGRGTGTTAGTQCLYYYATCSNAPGYSIPVGNFKLVGVVVDELSNVQPEGTIYFGSDLATSAEGYQVDGLHFVHTIRKGFTYSLDGILKSKNITATYVVSTAAYYAVFGRWGDCRVENVWACSPTNGSASNLYGFFRSISNCRIYGGYGIYFASLASGGDNYRYATINEAVVDGCKFYNCAYGVLASASGAPCYGVLGGIVIKNCEFFASYNSSVYSWNACKLRIENCTFDGQSDYSSTDVSPIILASTTGLLTSAALARCTFGRYARVPSILGYFGAINAYWRPNVSFLACEVYNPWNLSSTGYQDWMLYSFIRCAQYFTDYDTLWKLNTTVAYSIIDCKLWMADGTARTEYSTFARVFRKNLLGIGAEIREQTTNIQSGKFNMRLMPYSPNVDTNINSPAPIQIPTNPNKRLSVSLKFKNIGTPLRTKAGLVLKGPNFYAKQKITASGGWETLTVQGDCNPDLTEGVKHLSGVVGNLVGYWGLNGNSLDSHINDLDGTVENGPLTYTAGKLNQAVDLNGTSQCVNLGTSALLNPTRITVCAWVKYDSAAGYPVIVSRRSEVLHPAPTNQSYWIMIAAGYWECGVATTVWDYFGGAHGLPVPATGWHFVALRFDGTYIKFCLDGVMYQKAHAAPGDIVSSPTIPTLIGAQVTSPEPTGRYRWWDGKISDVSIFNRSLTDVELTSIYRQGRGLSYELIRQYPDPAIVEVLLSAGANNYDWSGRDYTQIWYPGRTMSTLTLDGLGGSTGRHFLNYVDVDSLTVAESDIP